MHLHLPHLKLSLHPEDGTLHVRLEATHTAHPEAVELTITSAQATELATALRTLIRRARRLTAQSASSIEVGS